MAVPYFHQQSDEETNIPFIHSLSRLIKLRKEICEETHLVNVAWTAVPGHTKVSYPYTKDTINYADENIPCSEITMDKVLLHHVAHATADLLGNRDEIAFLFIVEGN